jgi:hypothetical protein
MPGDLMREAHLKTALFTFDPLVSRWFQIELSAGTTRSKTPSEVWFFGQRIL